MRAYSLRGEHQQQAGRYREAAQFYIDGMTLLEGFGSSSGIIATENQLQYVECAQDADQCYTELKDWPAAIVAIERTIERTMPLGNLGQNTDSRYTWSTMIGQLASHYKEMGQTDKAIKTYLKQKAVLTELLERSPDMVYTGRASLLPPCANIAKLYRKTGNLAEEVRAMREYLKESALSIRRRLRSLARRDVGGPRKECEDPRGGSRGERTSRDDRRYNQNRLQWDRLSI